MNLMQHALIIEHTLIIMLVLIGCVFATYAIASKICEMHRKTFYRLACGFIIISFILGVRSYYAMLILVATYYIICSVMYYRCNKKRLEEDKKEESE